MIIHEEAEAVERAEFLKAGSSVAVKIHNIVIWRL